MAYPKYVAPLAGESLMSFIWRVSDENLLGRMQSVFKDIGHNASVKTPMSEFVLGTLADRTNVDIETLSRMHVSAQVTDGTTVAATHSAASVRPHLCPRCFGEAAYHRLTWHLRAITHCPFHGIPMLSHCECGKPLSWTRAAFLACSCGRLFSEQEPRGRTIDPQELVGLRVLAERCGEPFTWTPITPLVPEKFRALTLSDLARVLRILGHVAVYDEKRPLSSFGTVAPDGVPLVTHGLRLATDWPLRFDGALRKHPSTGAKTVLSAKLQKYLTNVLSERMTLGTAIIREQLQCFLTARGYFGRFGLQPEGDGPAHLMPPDAAADALGVAKARLAAFARAKYLWDPKEANGPYARWCVRSKVEIMAEKLESRRSVGIVLSITAAAARLGVDEPHIRELAAFGAFGPRAQARFEFEQTYRFLHNAEIEILIDKIRAAVSLVPVQELTTVDWRRASRAARAHDLCIGAIVRGILNGDITPAAFDGTIQSLRFALHQIQSLRDK